MFVATVLCMTAVGLVSAGSSVYKYPATTVKSFGLPQNYAVPQFVPPFNYFQPSATPYTYPIFPTYPFQKYYYPIAPAEYKLAPGSSVKTESFATPHLAKSEVRDDNGQFSLSYATDNGIKVNERGYLKPSAEGNDYVLAQDGSYSYTSPEGIPVSYTYTADENGFVVKGFPLPVPPTPNSA